MKYALVTGATKGIGKAIAQRLLSSDYHVFINYSNDDAAAEALKAELLENGLSETSFIKADMSDYANIEIVVNQIKQKTNSIDAIVLNAGVSNYKSFEDITWDEWNKVMNTNLSVPYFLVQALSNYINANACILFIGSVMGRTPHGISQVYGSSKAGVQYLSRQLVKVFDEKKVRVNCICPGFTDTPWQGIKTPEHRKRIEDKIALHRFARADEIADMCMAVINNTYVNGAVIDVDGGYSYR